MMETASLYFDNKNNNTNDKTYKLISRKNSFNMKRKDKVKLLAQATEMGDEDLVSALLKKKKTLVNTPNHVGRYPLHSAAQLGNLKIAQLLLEAGADINAIESTSKWTVLHFAALSKNKDMFHMLLSQPNIAVAEKGNREGNTALHYYARNFPDNYKETIEMLLQKGALIDAQNLNGETPLHNACWKGHVAIVRALIDNRANINSLNDHGETPLHWAARMGSIDIVKVLLEAGANPNVHGTTGTPLEVTPNTETSIRDLLQRAIQALQPQPHVPVQHHAQHEVLDMPLSIKRKASPFQWEIAYNEMKLTAKIGEGSFSDVFLGTWRGIEVAVKMLKNALSAESFEAFLQEISLVSKLRHPNVVLFLGACLDGPAVCYVTEYITGGNLYELLKKESVLGWPKKTAIAIEIARGMQYLHTHKILHGDLKSLNLLVDENYHIKVADFGLSKIIEDTPAEDAEPHSGGSRRKYKGTLTWQGPEVVNENSEYTEKSDVYSFGIVLWELISHRAPYEGLDAITVLRYIDQGQLPEIPANVPVEYAQLIRDCCARNPADRPDFDQILERLKNLRSKLISLLPPESDPSSNGQSPWTV